MQSLLSIIVTITGWGVHLKYTLNHTRDPGIIQGAFLNQGILGHSLAHPAVV